MSYRILKTSRLASVLALSVLSVACDSPLPPDEIPPPPPLNYTVSGAITEIVDGAPMPVAGARVALISTTQSTLTDKNGLYSIPGIRTKDGVVSVTKDGYFTVTAPFGSTTDVRLDISVEKVRTYTLSGMAYETTPAGRVPIEGVVLYCDGCGSPEGHTFVTTDAGGLYSFAWVSRGTTYVQVMGKEGYQYVGPAGTAMGVPVTTLGDTRFDVEFLRR